jgi:glycosyltransferase involved in cell wall biosynthesis
MRADRMAKRLLRRVGLRRPAPPWVVAEPEPEAPAPLDDFGLLAVVVTWMEADVIEATVRNAFAQGCDRVLLVDNDSPDDTVAVAVGAGAELARSFRTERLDEPEKIRILNEVVADASAASGREHVWWLWLDADELVHGPAGATVRELLTGLDRRYRIVGSRYFNHFPDRVPASLPGFHPAELQPLCQEKPGDMCALGHRKHHLQRFDRDGPPITSGLGFHRAYCADTLVEPARSTFTHHVPYRVEAVTRARSELLCGRDADGRSRVELYDRQIRRNAGTVSDMTKRHRTLDAVYAQRWEEVENLRRHGASLGVRPEPWDRIVDPADAVFATWYAPADLAAAIAAEHARR